MDTINPPPALTLSPLSDTFGSGTSGTNHDNITSATLPTFNGTAAAGSYVQLYDVTGGTTVSDGFGGGGQQRRLDDDVDEPAVGFGEWRIAHVGGGGGGPRGQYLDGIRSGRGGDRQCGGRATRPDDGIRIGYGRVQQRRHHQQHGPGVYGHGRGSGRAGDDLCEWHSVGHATADASGNYTIQSNALGADGRYQITAQQVDIAGNTSPSRA